MTFRNTVGWLKRIGKWGGQPHGAVIASTPKKVRKPARTDDWERQDVETWVPAVSESVFIDVIGYSLSNRNSEVSFRLYFNEERQELDYTTSIWASGGGGDVTMTEKQDKQCFDEAKGDGYVCNVHGHTHPDFSAFFSGTDLAQQDKVMYEENVVFRPNGGVVYYLVVGHTGLTWFMRRLAWAPKDDGGWAVTYTDKHVLLPTGVELTKTQAPIHRTVYKPYQPSVYVPPKNGSEQAGVIPWGTDQGRWGQDYLDYMGYNDDGEWVEKGGLANGREERAVIDGHGNPIDEEIWKALCVLDDDSVEDIVLALEGETLKTKSMTENELLWHAYYMVEHQMTGRNILDDASTYLFELLADFYDDMLVDSDETGLADRMRKLLSGSFIYCGPEGQGDVDSFLRDVEDILGVTWEEIGDMEAEWPEYIETLEYWYKNSGKEEEE